MGLLPLLLATALAGDPDPVAGLTPLPGFDRDTADADLEPLGALIGDAELVGLGESRHVVGGYLEAKARAVRWLVEHEGFRLIAIESPWAWSLGAHRYVAGEVDEDAEWAMQHFFLAFWDSQTVEMLAFLRQWNEEHPDDPVVFIGFDVQDSPHSLAEVLREEGLADEVVEACVKGPCEAPADQPWAELAVDTLETRRALDAARKQPMGAYSDVRDEGMAETLLRLREMVAPEARTVVLAHNLHLVRQGSDLVFEDMGEHLARELGEDWFVLGLVGQEVDSLGQGWERNHRRKDLERAIGEATDAPAALVDIDDSPWAGDTWRVTGRKVVPGDQVDGVLWLRHARAADVSNVAGAPWVGADAAVLHGMVDVVAVHRDPNELEARDGLWEDYSAWLESLGYEPVTRKKRAPWNQVRWQRWENPDGAEGYLEVRRAWSGDWHVYLEAEALMTEAQRKKARSRSESQSDSPKSSESKGT